MEYEKCYVYDKSDSRPAKRRRVEPKGLQASWELRRAAYQQAWTSQRDRITRKLQSVNATTLDGVLSFLDSAEHDPADSRIPTGLIATGVAAVSQHTLLHELVKRGSVKPSRQFASVSAITAPNLKTALKTIIQRATAHGVPLDEEDDDALIGKNESKLLNYDLQILANYVRERRIRQVVIVFSDVEALDSHVLSELIVLLGHWLDRIPLVLLFNVATSVEFLQQRLSQQATEWIRGRMFDVAPVEEEAEYVLKELTISDPQIWIAPSVLSMVLDQMSDYAQSVDRLVDFVQYAYMTCYYANALSLFLDETLSLEHVPHDHFEAARNLPSLRTFCGQLFEHGDSGQLRPFLDSDRSLFELIRKEIAIGRKKLGGMMGTLDLIRELQRVVNPSQVTAYSKLYMQALSNKLCGSTVLRALLLTLRKSTADTIIRGLDTILGLKLPDSLLRECTTILRDISALVAQQLDSSKPLRSEEDLHRSSLRTTIVKSKVQLSKEKSKLSQQDAAYTALLRRFTDALEACFDESLIDPQSLVFHEIFIYNLKSPHREVFTPRPRHAIERALASPHDYLDCECCAPEAADGGMAGPTLAATQPPTALVYQLYLEAGPLINVNDLWQAFRSMVTTRDVADDDERKDDTTMALFQRALADLRYLGLVKATKKRVDHVAKVAWRGL